MGAILLIAGCGSPTYVRSGLESDGGPGFDVESVEQSGTGGSPVGSGGVSASGGVDGSGGIGSGGTSATGGTTGTGGAGTGGAQGTGGKIGSGGAGGAATGGAATGGASTGGAGGMAAGGAGTGGAGTGGAGTGGAGTGGTAQDNAKFNFEASGSAQPWAAATNTPAFASIVRSTAQHYAGQASLAASIAAPGGNTYQVAAAPSSAIPAGATITFHLFVPAGSTIDWVQPYVQEGAPNFVWTGAYTLAAGLTAGAWNTITLKVPTSSAAISWIGTQFNVTATWTGTVYLDAINW